MYMHPNGVPIVADMPEIKKALHGKTASSIALVDTSHSLNFLGVY